MTMLGYQNKVLRINLTEKKASTEPLRMDFAEKYVGSKGLVIRYMYEELQPGIDARSGQQAVPDYRSFHRNSCTMLRKAVSGCQVACNRHYE